MRLIMMAAGPFAAPTFAALWSAGHDVLALVTRPIKTAASRRAPAASAVRAIASERGLPVFEPESINTAMAIHRLRELAADLFIVCDYGQILSAEALAAARLGGLNLHGSLLPRYRGAAPVQWAIFHGETETGVTVIHMTPLLDAGPRLVQRRIAIEPDETTPELEARLAILGASAVLDALPMLADWNGVSPLGEPQDPAMATRAPRLKKDDGWIDWRRSAGEIKNQVRAFQPWPGAFTLWDRPGASPVRLSMNRARVEAESASEAGAPGGAAPGVVIRRDKENLVIAAGEGAVAIEALQPAGKRVLQVAEFLRGYPIAVGDRLFGAAGET